MPLDDAQIGRIIVEFLAVSGGLLAACGSRAEALRCLRITHWRRRPKLAGDSRAYSEPEGIKIIDAGHPISTVVRTIPWDDVLDEAERLCGRTFDGPSKVEGDGLGATKEADASHPQGAPSQVSSLSLVDKYAAIEHLLACGNGVYGGSLAVCRTRNEALRYLSGLLGPIGSQEMAGLPKLNGTREGMQVTVDGVYEGLVPWDDVLDEAFEESGKSATIEQGTVQGNAEEWTNLFDGDQNPSTVDRGPPTPEQREVLRKSAAAAGVSTTTPTGIAVFDPEATQQTTSDGRRPHDPAEMPLDNGTVNPGAAEPLPGMLGTLRARRTSAGKTTAAAGDLRLIAVEAVAPNPWQPRRDFDAEALASLAESITTHGLQQPIRVRPAPAICGLHGAAYQLVDGERRWRAAKLAKASEIMAIVADVSDQEMAELALVANDQREDLNPIERAAAYARVLKETGVTQEALGARLGRSQSYVANLVRLLELPTEWRDKIISREMSPSHGKELLAVAKYPAVLKKLALWMKADGNCGTLEQFQGYIGEAVAAVGCDLDDKYRYRRKTYEQIGTFRATPEQLAQLDVVEAPSKWGSGARRYAMNEKLFWQLQGAYEKTVKKGGKNRTAGGGDEEESKPAKVTKLSPAEQKKRDAELQAQFARRLAAWKIVWLRWLISQRIAGDLEAAGSGIELAIKLLMFFAVERDVFSPGTGYRFDDLRVAVGAGRGSGRDAWSLLGQTKLPRSSARVLLGRWFAFDAKAGPRTVFPDDDVAALAGELGIDLAREWQKNLAGPLTEGFFELHTKEQLEALGKELGVYIDGAKSKGWMVKQLMAAAETESRLPKELGGMDEGRGTRKKKK
jgi:ParB family chromosome partitioning protein